MLVGLLVVLLDEWLFEWLLRLVVLGLCGELLVWRVLLFKIGW